MLLDDFDEQAEIVQVCHVVSSILPIYGRPTPDLRSFHKTNNRTYAGRCQGRIATGVQESVLRAVVGTYSSAPTQWVGDGFPVVMTGGAQHRVDDGSQPNRVPRGVAGPRGRKFRGSGSKTMLRNFRRLSQSLPPGSEPRIRDASCASPARPAHGVFRLHCPVDAGGQWSGALRRRRRPW